jgi:hypothetical protein
MRACLLLVALAVVVTGCGSSESSSSSTSTSTAVSTSTSSSPASSTSTTSTSKSPTSTTQTSKSPTSPVSVLGSNVSVDAKQIKVALRLRQPADVDPPIATHVQLTLPKGIGWQGANAVSCTEAVLKRSLDACPPASIIGTGEAIGLTDRSKTIGKITVVNGGQDHVYLSTIISNPAYVKAIVPGKISAPDDGLQLDLSFPPNLQTIAGVPVGLQELHLTIQRGPALVITSCPDDGWHYGSTVDFDDGTHVVHPGTVDCTDNG